jgi:predicted nucleic acid-binding protein
MVYLDTSVVVPLFVPEPASEPVTDWFQATTDPFIAADWLVTEFASALSLKQRTRELDDEQSRRVWTAFQEFCRGGLRLIPVERPAFTQAAQLAREATSGLRAGDSLHLAVALSSGVDQLATADAVLANSATRQGLRVIPF